MSEGANPIRHELQAALARLPKNGIVFTEAEVARIAEALGGYQALAALLNQTADAEASRP